MSARELTNGFANRFLMIWAERTRMLPFPKETPQAVVEHLARRTLEVLAFVRANRHDQRDHLRMELSPQAQWRYAQLYRGELNDDFGDGAVGALLERRAPMLLRLAMLMALKPKVYLFDEPTAGMSVDEVPVVLDLIRELKREGGHCVLLVEHKMDVVRELADRIIVLHQGALVAEGEPAEVIASPVVQQAYLGVAA